MLFRDGLDIRRSSVASSGSDSCCHFLWNCSLRSTKRKTSIVAFLLCFLASKILQHSSAFVSNIYIYLFYCSCLVWNYHHRMQSSSIIVSLSKTRISYWQSPIYLFGSSVGLQFDTAFGFHNIYKRSFASGKSVVFDSNHQYNRGYQFKSPHDFCPHQRDIICGTRLYLSTSKPPVKSTHFSVPGMGTSSTKDVYNNTDSEQQQKYTEYEKWVRRLYATNMFHPVKLGLTNMRKLHKLLGNPMDDPDRVVVHVAGTNGKGSVCLKIANTLQQQPGSKVGIFCSPHISSFRERMQVNGEMITEEEVVELLPKIYDLCVQHDIPATFFEITTALAFSFYAKRGAHVVVLETGLGGRLDATNIVKNPALCVITSIGLEHTRILGDTIEQIAREKGGIIKDGVPVLVGPHCPHEVLQQCAKERGGGPYYVPSLVFGTLGDFAPTNKRQVNGEDTEEITDYDLENQEISKAALALLKKSHPEIMKDLSSDQIHEGTSIRPPCRFEQIQKDGTAVVLDVAHNPPAMEYLVRKLQTTFPEASFRFVAGMSSDKDLSKCSRSLLSISDNDASRIHLVEAAHPRAAKLEAILEAEPSLKSGARYNFENRSITEQVVAALETAKTSNEVLVVCGSVFLMAEAREALGFNEPRDSDFIAEMAGAGVRHGQENFGNTTFDDQSVTTKR